jgi:hypothetical protein
LVVLFDVPGWREAATFGHHRHLGRPAQLLQGREVEVSGIMRPVAQLTYNRLLLSHSWHSQSMVFVHWRTARAGMRRLLGRPDP